MLSLTGGAAGAAAAEEGGGSACCGVGIVRELSEIVPVLALVQVLMFVLIMVAVVFCLVPTAVVDPGVFTRYLLVEITVLGRLVSPSATEATVGPRRHQLAQTLQRF